METSDALPLRAIADDDLADLVRSSPPFVSVYVPTDGAVEDADQRIAIRWKNLRGTLERADVDPALLEEIDEIVEDTVAAGDGLGVIADAAKVRLVDNGPLAETGEHASVSSAPVLAPIVRWRQEQPTALVVLTDSLGADLFALRRADPDVERTVDTEKHHLPKVAPGGWSQRRFQERAENTWEENAQDVARAVERLADRVDPRVIAVAGGVRAVSLLRDSLREDLDRLVEVVAGERPNEDGGDAIPEGVEKVIAAAVRADGDAVLARLREELGQQDLAVEGREATARALVEGRVALLAIGDPGDATVWVGSDPMHVAAEREVLGDLGVEDAREVPAAEGLIRAALASGAGVRIYDGTDPDGPSAPAPGRAPREGVGALVRWAAPAAR